MLLMILFGMGLRLVQGFRCAVCGQRQTDDERRTHAMTSMLFGLAVEAAIDRGMCPKCGSEGNDPAELRAAFDEWASSEESLEDLNADAEDLGLNDD